MRWPLAREGHVFVLPAALSALIAWTVYASAGGAPPLIAACGLSVLALALALFFRDPERYGPRGPGLVVAPADGRVIDIATEEENTYLEGPAVRISIFLSLLDVHVNRYPVAGVVEHRTHDPGSFEPAWRESAARANERASTGLHGRCRVLVRQVAGLAARRIVTYAGSGDRVTQGARMGLIRFGSRVDVFVPPDSLVDVELGQRALGGVTVIAHLAMEGQ